MALPCDYLDVPFITYLNTSEMFCDLKGRQKVSFISSVDICNSHGSEKRTHRQPFPTQKSRVIPLSFDDGFFSFFFCLFILSTHPGLKSVSVRPTYLNTRSHLSTFISEVLNKYFSTHHILENRFLNIVTWLMAVLNVYHFEKNYSY